MRALIVCLLLSPLTSTTSAAESIYKCVDPNGTIVYSQERCGSDAEKIETVGAPESVKPGDGDALAEQSEFVRMNNVRRQCDTRLQSIERRNAAELRRISSEIASIETRIRNIDPRLVGSTIVTDLRAQLAPLQDQRQALQLADSRQRETAQEQCRNDMNAEEQRQASARATRAEAARVEAARVEAQRAAEKAAADRAAEEKAKADANSQTDDP
jgi:chromosome segregation ATPase